MKGEIGNKFIKDLKITYKLLEKEKILRPTKIRQSENYTKAIFNAGTIEDYFSYEKNIMVVRRVWTIYQRGEYVLPFNISIKNEDEYKWAVPSVLYNNNKEGKGKFPKGGLEKGYSFREDRMPIPSCSILYNDKRYISLFTQNCENEIFLSSVKSKQIENRSVLTIHTPFREEPNRYTEKGVLFGGKSKRKKKTLKLKDHDVPTSFERKFYIVSENIKHHTETYTSLHEKALGLLKNQDPPKADFSKTASLRLNHLLFLYTEKKDVCGIKMGKGNGLYQGSYEYTAASFLVKSLEGASILARLAEECKRDDFIDKAIKIGDFFLQGKLPNGLHRDMYSFRRKEFGGYFGISENKSFKHGVNTRANGETMYNYLRLYEILKAKGIEKKEYLELAINCANFYIEHQLTNEDEGSYGRWYSKEGNVINSKGTNGGYIIPFLCKLYETTKDKRISNSLKKSAVFYTRLIDENAFYADTLDADCVDKEAGASLLRAFLALYEHEKKSEYLTYAKHAAAFVLSWVWTYNVAFAPKSALGKRNFKTKGLSSVSVAHHHLDFYGGFLAFDFLKLYEYSKEEKYLNIARTMLNASSQLIANENDHLERSQKFMGYQPEQVNHTDWDYVHHKIKSKGNFRFCVAWNNVLNLGALLDIRETYPNEVDFEINPDYL